MADFNQAVNITLKHEGGFVDNADDKGGATNMGITQRDLPDVDIKTISIGRVIQYYQSKFWNPLYNQIEDQSIANKIFDLGVLFGVGTVVSLVQFILKIRVDDSFGPQTLAAVNQMDSASLLVSLKTALVSHAVSIGASNQKQRQFVSGWINRINS